MKSKKMLSGLALAALLLALPAVVPAQAYPDLLVTSIECVPPAGHLAFRVLNRGNVPLPPKWKALARVTMLGAVAGHIDLGGPTSGDLTPAGGSAYYLTAFVIRRSGRITVLADANNDIREANEANNALTVLRRPCAVAPKKPDLTVTNIRFVPTTRTVDGRTVRDCDLEITLRNVGLGALPDAAYGHETGLALQIWIDGEARGGGGLWWADPGCALKPAGGSLPFHWAPGSDKPLIGPREHTVKVVIVDVGDVVDENEANNELTRTLRCGEQLAPPPLSRR